MRKPAPIAASPPLERVKLEGGWSLWPHFLVRAAGFPADLVQRLAAPRTSVAIDRLLEGACAQDEVAQVFAAERAELSAALRAIAIDPAFREAVLWQNRPAVTDGLDSLLRQPVGATDSRTRKKEYLVASYLQRYAVKNDTIGFFGPLGWGRFAPGDPAISAQPGQALLDRRAVFFEPWAIAALGDALAASPSLRATLKPRLSGELRVEGSVLFGSAGARGKGGSRKVLPLEARALRACDGQRSAKELATRLKLTPKACFKLLESLVERGWITWSFEVAIEAHPERRLAQQIADVPDRRARSIAAGALATLVSARDAVQEAAGDPARLEPALVALEQTFTRLTGGPAARNAGQTYGGRTLVYEECRRDLELRAGEQLRLRLERPLALLLDAARWYTHQIAAGFSRELIDLHARLGGGEVDLTLFWEASAPLFDGDPPAPIAAVSRRLEEKWAQLLDLPAGARTVELFTVGLAAKAKRLFAAPGPGWRGARHHSPDVMIAARGLEALARGEFQLVLGEIHPGVHTYSTLSVLSHSPVRDELEALYREDLPLPSIAPIPYEPFARSTHDTRLALADLHLDIGSFWRSPRPADRVLRVGDLRVVRRRDCLVCVERKGGRSFELLQVFERRIKMRAANHFHLLGRSGHSPRVSIDGVIVERERWTFAPAELGLPPEGDTLSRFIAARRFAHARGLPRRVFAKTPEEVKPVFVDFESPVLVDVLARMVRAGSQVTVTEMLPALGETWLPDAQGRTYVSELRLLAVDSKQMPVPSRPARAR